jgi:phenylalanyl-tRNA synthetase beta chain
MKISLNWLRELVELPPTVDELVRLLTMAGVEVEGVETRGVAIEKVVVAQINESVQHPNADRLSVCQIDDGSGHPRQIVCGAKNYKVGDKVPAALPGAVLPGDFKIKVGKLRGVESQGMLCSSTELGLPKGEDGLLILSPDAKVGAPLSELFPGDTILDLEITPNRPDLLSMWGIAKEIGAITGRKPVHLPHPILFPSEASSLQVAVETKAECYYSALKVRGVKIGYSPAWLSGKLEAAGLRPINNAVDATNYYLLLGGQPTHVFDAAKVQGIIRVRDARQGEQLLALDGKTYSLTIDDLVIADDFKALAIAGVMGGEESIVTSNTRDIILEIANFEPARIRRTSRRLGLSSDASYRFERGVDVINAQVSAEYLGSLLAELTSAAVLEKVSSVSNSKTLEGRFKNLVKPVVIPLRLDRIKLLLGVKVSEERIEQILNGFGFRKQEDGWAKFAFRPDVTREVDLIEEVARVIGMKAIPSRVQARFSPASEVDRAYNFAMTLRRAFSAQGLSEARNITLVPNQPLGVEAADVDVANVQRVKNPMIDDQVVLRPHLLHGLFTALRENLRAGAESVRLFEIGRVFSTKSPAESSHAALVLSGAKSRADWRKDVPRELDLYDLKGILTAALGTMASFEAAENPALALALAIKVEGQLIGHAGQLWPAEARALDAVAPVLFAEFDLAALANASGVAAKKYREIVRFPAVKRDMALLVPLVLPHAAIENCLQAVKEPLLEKVELFDIYTDSTGAKIPADQKSLAYSLTYRASDRTLLSNEVEVAHARLKDRLKADLNVSFRE